MDGYWLSRPGTPWLCCEPRPRVPNSGRWGWGVFFALPRALGSCHAGGGRRRKPLFSSKGCLIWMMIMTWADVIQIAPPNACCAKKYDRCLGKNHCWKSQLSLLKTNIFKHLSKIPPKNRNRKTESIKKTRILLYTHFWNKMVAVLTAAESWTFRAWWSQSQRKLRLFWKHKQDAWNINATNTIRIATKTR